MEINNTTPLTDDILINEYPVLKFNNDFIQFGFFKVTRKEIATVERLEELKDRMIEVLQMKIQWR